MTTTNSNFYQVGASLPVDAPSYVRRQADEEFFQKLLAGKFCYVFNSRQMGKSSLRVQTMQRLQQQGTVCAAIDLTGSGKVNPEQWYGGIVYNLSESCQLEDRFDFDWQVWWQKHQTILSPVQCLSSFIKKVLLAKIQEPIVIFVDEIDKVLSQNFSLDDFFALIRFFQNQRVDNPIFQRLTFALLGVATPSDLIKDKIQTPFNIGEAIELHGFQIDEVEPLIEGLQGRFNHPQGVMAEILDWTGGQPFLTQKLCKLMVAESGKDNPRSVEEVVKSRVIKNWESQDDPEHLRTIRDRILPNKQRAGYLLGLYYEIQEQGEVSAYYYKNVDKSVEFNELILSGLVVQREGKLRVSNQVYQQVFDRFWVEDQLENLRPYSENFRLWIASGGQDKSLLLQGNALKRAERWAEGKILIFPDTQFLAASREKEIAERYQKAESERERKDKEAAEQRNQVLSEVNKRNIEAKRRIRNGTIVLVLSVLGGLISGALAVKAVVEAQNELKKTYIYLTDTKKLKALAKKLPQDSDKAIDILKKADITFKNPQLEQIYLHASKSLAHQYLKEWKSAEESIQISMQLLRVREFIKDTTTIEKLNNELLQIKVFALSVMGNLLSQRGRNQTLLNGGIIVPNSEGSNRAYNKHFIPVISNARNQKARETYQKAREAYQEAFNIIQENKITTLQPEFYISEQNLFEHVHRQLIELPYNSSQENNQLDQVRISLKHYYLDELKNLLSKKNWQSADLITWKLLLSIARREKEGNLDIKSIKHFFCPDLKKIDQLWVQNSGGRFGFSVQQQIWKDTGNRLDITAEWTDNDIKTLLRFVSRVGWYKRSDFLSYTQIIKEVEKDYQQVARGMLPIGKNFRGTLPTFKKGILFSRCYLGFAE